MHTVISLRWGSVAVSALALAFLSGCTGGGGGVPVEVEFGPNERAMVKRLQDQVDKGIESFDIRGKQAIDLFGQLPAALGREGATLVEFQLTEWGSAMFGKGVVAVDCTAEGVQQRCIKNLEMVKDALKRAVDKVNELEKEKIASAEKKSKWATFLRELRFEPVLLDPRICFLDHESVRLQYTDATATAVMLRLPGDGLLKARGTGLYAPRPSPEAANDARQPTFSVWVVTMNGPKETDRKDISACVRYTLDSTIQLDLNAVRDQIGVADSYIEIVTKAEPTKKVEIGDRNQIPFVYLDPPAPPPPPPSRVISLIVGGRTEGDNKDENRGFHVDVYAGNSLVGQMPDYCYVGKIKDADFPSERFSNRAVETREVGTFKVPMVIPARTFKEFPVPNTGRLWVKASQHHDCECWFNLTYTIQTYKWGAYDRATKQFAVDEHQRFDRKYTSPKHFFRGDEPAGTIAWDFNWEGQ
jgi:hypothetical protein